MRRAILQRRSIYRNPVVARLVYDGIFVTGNAWHLDRHAWPRPMTGRRDLLLIDGGRR